MALIILTDESFSQSEIPLIFSFSVVELYNFNGAIWHPSPLTEVLNVLMLSSSLLYGFAEMQIY